jgi:hypothetical protein
MHFGPLYTKTVQGIVVGVGGYSYLIQNEAVDAYLISKRPILAVTSSDAVFIPQNVLPNIILIFRSLVS